MHPTLRFEVSIFLPGIAALLQRRWLEALLIWFGMAFFVVSALLCLVSANDAVALQQLPLFEALSTLPSKPRIPPTVPVCFIVALAIDLLSAYFLARPVVAKSAGPLEQ